MQVWSSSLEWDGINTYPPLPCKKTFAENTLRSWTCTGWSEWGLTTNPPANIQALSIQPVCGMCRFHKHKVSFTLVEVKFRKILKCYWLGDWVCSIYWWKIESKNYKPFLNKNIIFSVNIAAQIFYNDSVCIKSILSINFMYTLAWVFRFLT